MIRLAYAGRATLQRGPIQRQIFNISKRRSQTTNTADITAKVRSNVQHSPAQAQEASATVSTTSQSIAAPANSWLHPLKNTLSKYTAVNQRRPYVTQLLSTITIWLLGDLLSQYVTSSPPPAAATLSDISPVEGEADNNKPKSFSEAYDPKRTARALIIGGIISIPAYRWFLHLGTLFNYPSSRALSISAKVVFNQFTFTPAFGCTFFGSQQVLEQVMNGEVPKAQDVGRRIADTVPTAWVNSWKVWPAVTAVSFSVVPPDLRSLFAGVAAVGWQAYISVLNQRALREEAKKGRDAAAVAGREEREVVKRSAVREEGTNANAGEAVRC